MPILNKSDKAQVESYNLFLSKKEDVSIFQDYNFLACDKNHEFEIVYIEKNGNIMATMAFKIYKLKNKYSIFYCQSGPVCDIYDLKTIEMLFKEALKIAKRYNAIAFVMDPNVIAEDKIKKIYHAKKFKIIKRLPFIFTNGNSNIQYVVDLKEKDEKTLMESFMEKTRYNVETSYKKNIKVKIGTTQKDFERFYEMFKKENLVLYNDVTKYETIKSMLKNINYDCIRVYCVSMDNKPLSCGIFCNYGGRVLCLDEVSIKDPSALFTRSRMYFEAMKWGLDNKCKSYIVPQERDISGENLRFKE